MLLRPLNHFFSDAPWMEVVYWVPVIVTLQLKVVMDPQFDAAVKVSIAGIEFPAGRIVFC